MLLRQHRRRHQHGHLLAVLHGLERGAQGDLGLAIAHVAADEAIHRARALEVGFDFFDRAQLVFGLDVGERRFEFLLPGRVAAESVTGDQFARGIQVEQFFGHLGGGGLRARFDVLPFRRAQPLQRGRAVLRADVFRKPVGLVNRDVQPVSPGVLHGQVFAAHAFDGECDESLKRAHAMLGVHHVIARLHVGKERFGRDGFGPGAASRLRAHPAKDFAIREDVKREA